MLEPANDFAATATSEVFCCLRLFATIRRRRRIFAGNVLIFAGIMIFFASSNLLVLLVAEAVLLETFVFLLEPVFGFAATTHRSSFWAEMCFSTGIRWCRSTTAATSCYDGQRRRELLHPTFWQSCIRQGVVLERREMRRVCDDGELELRREAASCGDPTSGGDPAGQVARPWRSRPLCVLA